MYHSQIVRLKVIVDIRLMYNFIIENENTITKIALIGCNDKFPRGVVNIPEPRWFKGTATLMVFEELVGMS